MTRRAFWTNVAALCCGLLAAILLALWPPRVPQYTDKGEPIISWTANPTEGGRRWGKPQEWASYAGPGLLCLAFLLQLVALCGHSVAQTGQAPVPSPNEDAKPDSNVVVSLLRDEEAYQNHKEQMAYLAAAAYIGGAAWLLQANPVWARSWFVVLTALIVFAYVICQLCARKEADRRVDELLRLLPAANRWSEPTGCRDSAIAFVGKGARWILPIATLIAMVIWTLAIAIRYRAT